MGNRTARISEERQAEMARLYQDGLTREKVAAACNSSIETVTKILRLQGIPVRPAHEPLLSPEKVRTIVDGYRAGISVASLANESGCTTTTMYKVLRKNGVQIRDDRGRTRHFTHAEFQVMRDMAATGRSQSEIATALGSARDTIQGAMASEGIPPARTGAARGSQHGAWKGGRYLRHDGYMLVTLPADSPYRVMGKRGNEILEHRLVMAEALGRMLKPWETVHHIDGVRTNNNLSNLQLRSGQHGQGAAYRCLDCGSANVTAVKLHEA